MGRGKNGDGRWKRWKREEVRRGRGWGEGRGGDGRARRRGGGDGRGKRWERNVREEETRKRR